MEKSVMFGFNKNFFNIEHVDEKLHKKFIKLNKKNSFTEQERFIKLTEEVGEIAKELLRTPIMKYCYLEELVDAKLVLDDLLLAVIENHKITPAELKSMYDSKLAKWEKVMESSRFDTNASQKKNQYYEMQLKDSSDTLNIIPNEEIEIIDIEEVKNDNRK